MYTITYQVYSYLPFQWAEFLVVGNLTDLDQLLNKNTARLASADILVSQHSSYSNIILIKDIHK